MSADVYRLVEMLFWVFAVGVACLPLRWAILSLVLLANIDVISPGSSSITAVGWDNAARTLIIPALLLLRMTGCRLPRIRSTVAVRAWVALMLYAALSSLWSPFKLSAAKMVGYLLCYFLLYVVFDLAWSKRLIDHRLIILSVWGSLFLGCLATYALGDPFGTADVRFTSFTSPQTFAFYMLCMLAILMFGSAEKRLRWASIAGCLVGIVLTGSRFAFVSVAFLLASVWLKRGIGMEKALRASRLLKASIAAAICMLAIGASVAWAVPRNRLVQLFDLGLSGSSLEDIGTFAWRLQMYQDAGAALSHRGALALFWGSGTSSAGNLALEDFSVWPAESLDPNRTLHNEFIRVFYEWGFVGLLLTALLLTRLMRYSWKMAVRVRYPPSFSLLGVIPGILIGLSIENVLAAAPSVMGVGTVLVLTYSLSVPLTPGRMRGAFEGERLAQCT